MPSTCSHARATKCRSKGSSRTNISAIGRKKNNATAHSSLTLLFGGDATIRHQHNRRINAAMAIHGGCNPESLQSTGCERGPIDSARLGSNPPPHSGHFPFPSPTSAYPHPRHVAPAGAGGGGDSSVATRGSIPGGKWRCKHGTPPRRTRLIQSFPENPTPPIADNGGAFGPSLIHSRPQPRAGDWGSLLRSFA